jgi:excisionase family DNA binding protein
MRKTKALTPERATLSVKESTKITGFGITHSYRLVRTRAMPSIKVGNKFFIPKAALLKWLENAGDRP